MAKTIYVGNLSFDTTEEELRKLFEEYGTVHEVKMITDRGTGRFRGFSFVDMDEEAAGNAIAKLDGVEFGGRTLRVNEARERPGGNR